MKEASRREARIRAFEVLFGGEFDESAWTERSGRLATITPNWTTATLPLLTTELLDTYAQHAQEIQDKIKDVLENWSYERLTKCNITLLKLGVAELLYMRDIPVAVTIDEYVELSRTYAEPDAFRFINGILDKIAKRHR